ncbi:hypothetical protein BGZ60DRAFT_567767 [Tricladium varicosporioides]|nr:hypothetical protein BGZ60DRAFT_567767 [Hymenoscyphus varicosporioides]
MAEAIPQIPSGPRIVLAIDYGTTYTGLAWMVTKEDEDIPALKDIKIFNNWPEKTSVKVPSTISYSASSPQANKRQWGHSIDDDSRVLRWTKLELEPRETLKELEDLQELAKGLDLVKQLKENSEVGVAKDIPKHLSKNAEDIVRDYLYKVAREWRHEFAMQSQASLNAVPVDIVITHPASWEYESLNKTYQVVLGAFNHHLFPRRRHIYLVSEPEACALYILQDSIAKGKNTLISGDCFVLCDAGGGTVDLVSCRVESVEPLRYKNVGMISGGKFGATLIDKSFLEYLDGKILNVNNTPTDCGSGGHFISTPLDRIFLDKFQIVKHSFKGTNDFTIEIPDDAELAPDSPDIVQGGELPLTSKDLLAMFKPSVDGILGLIQKQISFVQTKKPDPLPYHVQTLFLAGGFSENKHLFNEVQKLATSENIDLITATIRSGITDDEIPDSWGGVVKGAVLFGMGIGVAPPVAVKSCPRHIGICVAQTYTEWRHRSQNAVQDEFYGGKMVSNQLLWLLKKGALMRRGDKPLARCTILCPFKQDQVIRVVVVATELENPPSTREELPESLSLTTERWGLEPFPNNLFASQQYLKSQTGVNKSTTIDIWGMPNASLNGDSRVNNTICSKAQRSPSSGCVLVVEGILKTRVGPAHSSIYPLAVGISFLLAIIISIAIVMGSSKSKPSFEDRARRLVSTIGQPHKFEPFPEETVRSLYNPPPLPEKDTVRIIEETDMAREIAQCSALLRQLYTLDIEIWSSDGSVGLESEVLEKKHKANVLFDKIDRMVHSWKYSSNISWTAEQKSRIVEICQVLEAHSLSKKYPV